MQKKLKKKKLQTEDLFLLVLWFCRALCVCGLSEIVIIVIAWKGAIQDLLTAREPSPICMLKWPGRNCVQITCIERFSRAQHVICHVVRRDSSTIRSDRVEIAFILALFYWLKPLTDEGGEETGVPGENSW